MLTLPLCVRDPSVLTAFHHLCSLILRVKRSEPVAIEESLSTWAPVGGGHRRSRVEWGPPTPSSLQPVMAGPLEM